jgi:hypothetical protein
MALDVHIKIIIRKKKPLIYLNYRDVPEPGF